MIRTIIVDDEEPARAKLRRWLGKQPDFKITGEFADGISAAQSIMAGSPDLAIAPELLADCLCVLTDVRGHTR